MLRLRLGSAERRSDSGEQDGSFSSQRKSRLWSLSVQREHAESRCEGEADGGAEGRREWDFLLSKRKRDRSVWPGGRGACPGHMRWGAGGAGVSTSPRLEAPEGTGRGLSPEEEEGPVGRPPTPDTRPRRKQLPLCPTRHTNPAATPERTAGTATFMFIGELG